MTEPTSEDRVVIERPAGHKNRAGILAAVVALLALAAVGYGMLSAGKPTLKVGQPAPNFSIASREGLKIQSDLLKNNVVVVNFFASWCKPCQDEAADLEAIWKEYQPRGAFFLGVTYQDADAKVAEFIQRHGITYMIADDDGTLSKKFGVTGVPETYVIGRDGLLAYKAIGEIDPGALRAALAELMP